MKNLFNWLLNFFRTIKPWLMKLIWFIWVKNFQLFLLGGVLVFLFHVPIFSYISDWYYSFYDLSSAYKSFKFMCSYLMRYHVDISNEVNLILYSTNYPHAEKLVFIKFIRKKWWHAFYMYLRHFKFSILKYLYKKFSRRGMILFYMWFIPGLIIIIVLVSLFLSYSGPLIIILFQLFLATLRLLWELVVAIITLLYMFICFLLKGIYNSLIFLIRKFIQFLKKLFRL